MDGIMSPLFAFTRRQVSRITGSQREEESVLVGVRVSTSEMSLLLFVFRIGKSSSETPYFLIRVLVSG